MGLTKEQVLSLKYKVENPFLREWSLHFGIVDCVTKIQICIKNGFGYMGNKRIDRNFLESLSYGDRVIYNGIISWLTNK